MKYFIIAGEPSGDLHGSLLVKEISKLDEQAIFKGVGGEKMQQSNVELLFGLDSLAFMGFWEVIKNLFTILLNFYKIKKSILHFQPDVVILIDYPGFNLRMAKWCKKKGFKVAYYISPTIWAWHESRVEIIKKCVDLMLCISSFEPDFYQKHQYQHAHYVGHPLLDIIDINTNKLQSSTANKKHIALLPGSRKQEISNLLPIMLDVANNFPNEKFVIAGLSRLTNFYIDSIPQNVSFHFDATYETLQLAKAALVCSGTATLETALFNIPQVVMYKTSWLNYQIGKRLAKVQFISLPNLIANQKLVDEWIQDDCTTTNCKTSLEHCLNVSGNNFYSSLFEKMEKREASQNAASLIFNLIA